MRKFLLITSFLCGVSFVCGCASRHDLVLARLLMDLERETPARTTGYAGPDSPEDPGSSLPPAPVGDTAGKGTITIQPDSLLQISVEEDHNLDGSYTVNEIGAVSVGYIGPVILYGMTEKQAEQKIKTVLENRYFRKGKANVTVKIQRPSYDKVKVVGAVNKPGLIMIGAGDVISLNDALRRAGGLRVSARGAKIKVVRDGLLTPLVDILEGKEYSMIAADGKPMVPLVTLRNNDVVYVFSSQTKMSTEVGEKTVLVLGEVRREGYYTFSGAEPCTIMHLILKMGGLPTYANRKAIRILRRDEKGNEEEIKVDATEILDDGNPDDDVPLENGDRIIVPARRISLF